jgi:hypothetical protein
MELLLKTEHRKGVFLIMDRSNNGINRVIIELLL